MKQTYREDIDGLRAIAVLAVVFYHAGFKYFSGGFVGVDVFFVISGFLITGIIAREIKLNDFSLIKFYERRIRRIYPAAFALTGFVLIAGLFIYDASNYTKISRSVAANTVFLSNMLFWWESGYFDSASFLKPLLHTWSLAVEEQFYIFFPFLMILTARFFKSKFNAILSALWIVSFAACIYATYNYTSAAFYFMPLRAWELFTGSLIALNYSSWQASSRTKNILALIGMGLILFSVLTFSENTDFPGWAASLPVAGSGLILLGGNNENSLLKRFLSQKPLVFIGKISYSLYLWHWSLLVMGKYYLIRDMSKTDSFIWLILVFLVSTLSWKFIETPFRVNPFWTQRRIFVFGLSIMTATFFTGVLIFLNHGFPQRFPQSFADTDNTDPERARWSSCQTKHKKEPPSEVSLCTIGAPEGQPEFLFWGDSHARAAAPAINQSALKYGVTGYFSSMPGCPPLLGIDKKDQYRGGCSGYNDMVIQYITDHPEIKTVILSARWNMSADGRRFKNEEGATKYQVDVWENTLGSSADLFELGLTRTVEKLSQVGRKVVIVTGIPEIGYDVPSALAIASRTGRDLNAIIAPTMAEYQDRNKISLSIINKLSSEYSILLIQPQQALCNEKICIVEQDGMPLYRDDDHLTTYGAHFMDQLFEPLFESLKK